MGTTTIMQFTDRCFWATIPWTPSPRRAAGIAALAFLSFFIGHGQLRGVFIAQYTGASRPERVGAALWQGIWFCLLSGLARPAARPWPVRFALAGHAPSVVAQEQTYFLT
jgi:MATE family multidrug resistance protein